ncbi:MAG TPA: type II toxin-antitoxin system VapC family toxin [Brevundimonas sp.]|jgi:ribonuclease VapC|uniref:type II toxin-antitoxin system VapC family toxin n=1 Tax=Brevundimonas sp. TaxID=1871086 RepID=UPI002E0D40C5|nr:type II toxin-antitoxin system VapC family toxin [Brevundimonas sp.]
MVVDASALLAILLLEDDAEVYRDALLASTDTRLSPVGYWEAAIRLQHFRGLAGVVDLDRLLVQLAIEIAPASAATARLASAAERAFGKRTPARLNLGDCFALALAQELDAPLLWKGEDFALTDARPAL